MKDMAFYGLIKVDGTSGRLLKVGGNFLICFWSSNARAGAELDIAHPGSYTCMRAHVYEILALQAEANH